MNFRNYSFIILVSLLIISCNNGPKVINKQSNENKEVTNSGIFTEEKTKSEIPFEKSSSSIIDGLHTVVVKEILPATKYVYLNVTEAGEDFWIATRSQDITLGGTYFYKRGLLKTNYESKEHNRVFDKIYLVSSLVAENHKNNSNSVAHDFSNKEEFLNQKENIPTHTEKIIPHKGSLTIAEIVANPTQYEGKTVQLSGKCVKINPNIMERNWIHLQDGSRDNFDLVITSSTFVPEGKIITIRALVSLNRDFGAGYQYDLILENGTIIE